MASTKRLLLIALLATAVFLTGCAKPGNNPRFARKALNCVYRGSLAPLNEHLTPDVETGMTDEIVRDMGKELRNRFGKPRKVSPKSYHPQGDRMTIIYTVTAKKGEYEMVMTTDKVDCIAALWFPALGSEGSAYRTL